MTITVSDFKLAFGNVTDTQIANLVGRSDYKATDVIPLEHLARSNEMAFKIYGYQKVGRAFLDFFTGQSKVDFAQRMHCNIPHLFATPPKQQVKSNREDDLFSSLSVMA